MTGFTMDPSKLQYLAQNFNPQPILASMDQMGGAQGLQGTPNSTGFAQVVNPWTGGDTGGGVPATPGSSFSGVDPKLMQQFGGMLQTPPQTPHFIGGAAPQRPTQVQIQQPPQAAPGGSPGSIPGLAAILAGSNYKR